MSVPFVKTLDFGYGAVAELTPMVRRVVARNPSAFTFHGTGTYIVGRGKVAVIDPGPDDPAHIDALARALRNETVTHILVTHTHRDHSPGTAELQRRTGAPSFAFGPHPLPKGALAVEEGGDHDFRPDEIMADGDTLDGHGWTLSALHTPGHISNHLCFNLHEDQALFSGDHVMGWSTTVISPPDGNMTDYYASLRKLLTREEQRYYPTHGAPIDERSTGLSPQHFVQALLQHRAGREEQIMRCLAAGPQTIPQMVATMYHDVPSYLHPAAARSVLAHLIHMTEEGRAISDGPPNETAVYRLG